MGLLRPGDTCWRLAHAPRLKVLVDCQDYFAALRTAMAGARRSIHLLGWGFDPRTPLGPGDPGVGELLISLKRVNPDLDVRLLIWRSALPISATQAFFPHRARAWFRGTGVDFQLDANVPFGACHHQKVVVIDDALAFVGGADLMPGRWDTPEHRDEDPRRVEGGGFWPSRHEVMALVDGPAASAFGALFRERWRGAVGELPEPADKSADLWPVGLAPDMTGIDIAIARTEPAWRGRDGVEEIRKLTLEAVLGARELIYLENQYFTWPLMVEALAARLAEPEGPEVVLIVSERSPSYFDRITMDRARSTALWRLASSDVFGRFHAFAPWTAGGERIIVHAKAMIVDDRLVRISSANLNNRSHGFDTECELALEAETQAQQAAVAALRHRMAAHWVGHTGEELAEVREEGASLANALWALDHGARLRPLTRKRLGPLGEFIAEFHLGDPDEANDSWNLGRRREKLLTEARAVRLAAAITPSG